MANPYRTVTVPVNPGAQWLLTWPAKDPADDDRDYRIDATAYLTQAGRTVTSVGLITAEPTLIIPDYAADLYGVTFHIQGGINNTQPMVTARLMLDNGDVMTVGASLPIRALAGALFVPPTSSSTGSTAGIVSATITGVTGSYLAGATISGHRALMLGASGSVLHADPNSVGYLFVGISTSATATGQTAIVVLDGVVSEPTWAWPVGAALYVSLGGVLTTTAPTVGVLQQVAVATSPTDIIVHAFPPIVRN